MIEAFKESPILLLFVVAAIGYGIGSIRIKGNSLGVAAVLFVGLGIGALDPELHISSEIIFLGLTIFVYTIGLQSGPAFFANLKNRGSTDVFFIIFLLFLSSAMTVGLHYLFDFDAAITAGLFAGVTTNTSALAGLLDLISNQENSELVKTLSKDAVVGYSLSYPMGVIGVMAAMVIVQRLLKIDFKQEAEMLKEEYPTGEQMDRVTLEIQKEVVVGVTLRELFLQHDLRIVIGRLMRDGEISLPYWDTRLQKNDLIRVIGSPTQVKKAVDLMGEIKDIPFSSNDEIYEVRTILVSNKEVTGQKLATLNLPEKYAAIASRVIRGDVELLANSDTIVEQGDRILFVAHKKDMPKLIKLFGDSFEAQSHVNLLSFGLGMAMGLLLGMVSIELPGGVKFRLGFAIGPLIVALILGTLRRTGPIVWTLPYNANLTLRQIGLIFLLAGIGVNSGHTFLATLMEGKGGMIFLAGTIISIVATFFTLVIGYKLFKIPFSFLAGMVANQPAILDFAIDKAGNKLPNIGFTTMLPIAMVIKILVVQLLFAFLS